MSRISDTTALRRGMAIILAVTLWRVVMLAFNNTELYTDESQYWFWGQDLDFGYYSKPPMIAWVIRAMTDLAGSSTPFWVRLPAPLFHMGTALVLMGAARRLYGLRTAAWAGPVYVLLPMATLGSALISTDTVMLFFYALALLAWLHLQGHASQKTRGEGGATGWAIGLGGAIGLGLLSKYAMLFFPLGASLSAVFVAQSRIRWREAAIAGLVAILIVAPNIWWNFNTDGTTLRHTLDNANWGGNGDAPAGLAWIGPHLKTLFGFLASQFAVFGPILFATYLLRLLRPGPVAIRPPHEAMLLWVSAPTLFLILVQAFISRAHANWAVTAYIAGSLLVTAFLVQRGRRWLYASQLLHLVVAIALPLMLVQPEIWRRANGGRQYLARYLDRAEVSLTLATLARDNGLDAIVTNGRGLAADLHYTLRGRDLKIFALPRPGFPASYYEQEYAVPADFAKPVLFVSIDRKPDCAQEVLLDWPRREGAFTGHHVIASRVDPACLKTLLRDGMAQ